MIKYRPGLPHEFMRLCFKNEVLYGWIIHDWTKSIQGLPLFGWNRDYRRLFIRIQKKINPVSKGEVLCPRAISIPFFWNYEPSRWRISAEYRNMIKSGLVYPDSPKHSSVSQLLTFFIRESENPIHYKTYPSIRTKAEFYQMNYSINIILYFFIFHVQPW